ncbi:response regulator [Zobellia amurskyensis]|uniref:Response regulator n=1 Tax=Zobellia amurskyensis TaxID=248905 RepID=A0A7X2ZVH6_9FLAO|nr:response regulator [Zobellia amurskyensis]MUH37136.1 response regulator [Zobellia amurskyensis]
MKNTPKICIIDDDYIYRYTVVKKMETMHLLVNTLAFEDGEMALAFILDNLNIDSELPDVIFLDIDMPVMDGFQFIKEFAKIESQLNKKIDIYMISSSLDPVDIERAQRIDSIADYFVKPIKTEQLQSVFLNLQ